MSQALSFLPTLPATLLGPLSSVFAKLGLPAPAQVQALRRPGALGSYLVTSVTGGQLRLTTVLADLCGSGVNGALIAARRLEGWDELPITVPTIALPLESLGCPALVHGLPAGHPADARLEPTRALRAIGRVVDGLRRHPQPDEGMIAGPHRFYPSHDTWGAQWQALAARWAELARRGGTALQPMTDLLLSEIDPGALPMDEPPVLVPGGLAPGAIWLDDSGDVLAVDGWIPAWCGDPWSAWAPLLHLSAGALATVRGAHATPPDLVAQADRLRVYAAGHVLYMLAEAAAAHGPHERVVALQRAISAFEVRTSLAARLAAASGAPGELTQVGAERTLALATLDRLVREPVLTEPGSWLAVAGNVLLAHQVGGSPDLVGWREVARKSVARLEPGLGPAITSPSGPGEAPADTPQGWILRWIVQELQAAAGGQGPESLGSVVARLSRRAPPPTQGAAQRLLEATLGLAAVARLADGAGEAMRARLVAQARAAWDELDFGVPAPVVRPARYLRHYADPAAHAAQSWPVGLLLYAFARAGELPLPASPPAILRALGVEAP